MTDNSSFFDATISICLSSIKENYQSLKERSKSEVCAATVKADAYGLGITPISGALYDAGCRDFFVATLNEAIFLSKLRSDINIYVFHGIKENELNAFYNHKITPVLNDISEIKLWNNYGYEIGEKLPAIFHFDTGINRLGINPEHAEMIRDSHNITDNLDIKYIMSHLACSNEIDNIRNQRQLEIFKKTLEYFPRIKATLSNSSGIFLSDEYHFDMVRPGAALFGINPCPYAENPMKNILGLKAKVIQIKEITQDGMVGYGNICPISKGARLAIIPVGYADGYLRSLTNKAHCYFNGKKLMMLGKISMDMSVVDISELKPGEINVGDEVEILGNNINLSNLSQQAGTIAYEILTSLGNRFRKIYKD